jgi:hypothetical protein
MCHHAVVGIWGPDLSNFFTSCCRTWMNNLACQWISTSGSIILIFWELGWYPFIVRYNQNHTFWCYPYGFWIAPSAFNIIQFNGWKLQHIKWYFLILSFMLCFYLWYIEIEHITLHMHGRIVDAYVFWSLQSY